MIAATDHLETSSGKPRLAALDSLRGLASLAVLFGHTLTVCEWNSGFSRWLLVNNLFDGRSAVTMFFVLSGFVLTLGHLGESRKPLNLVPFYARRATRIWLPWFAFFLLSLLAKTYFHFSLPQTIPPLTAYHLSFWTQDITFIDVLRQMIFQLYNSERVLLPQDWSLGIELRASLLIPFFLIFARKSWIVLAAAAWVIAWVKPSGGFYYASFAIGVITAQLHARQTYLVNSWVLLLAGYLLYQSRWIYEVARLCPDSIGEREIWLIGAVGCGLLILAALRCLTLRRILEHPLLAHLGRVSYSLYLVQVIVLLCLAPWIVKALNTLGVLSGAWLQLLLLLAVTSICLILADLGERWIEVPCIHLGKFLTRWLESHALVRKFKV